MFLVKPTFSHVGNLIAAATIVVSTPAFSGPVTDENAFLASLDNMATSMDIAQASGVVHAIKLPQASDVSENRLADCQVMAEQADALARHYISIGKEPILSDDYMAELAGCIALDEFASN